MRQGIFWFALVFSKQPMIYVSTSVIRAEKRKQEDIISFLLYFDRGLNVFNKTRTFK